MNKNDLEEITEDNVKDIKVKPCKKFEGRLYALKLEHTGETEYALITDGKGSYQKGQSLIAETRYGMDLVDVMGEVFSKMCTLEPIKVLRVASEDDLKKRTTNVAKEKDAFTIALKKIEAYKLDMKLIDVHFLLEEPKILFLFTSEGRVDFRDLVKDLVATFHARIELRQIGVRDATRTIGGLAVCGRDFCCHSVTDQLKPVSIKMLKDQNLSLNSVKISGNCGRLLCCLSYEHDTYIEIKSKFPTENTRIKYQDEIWRVKEINAITEKAILISEDKRLASFTHEELGKTNDGKWFIKEKK